jgi:hypothetical protein
VDLPAAGCGRHRAGPCSISLPVSSAQPRCPPGGPPSSSPICAADRAGSPYPKPEVDGQLGGTPQKRHNGGDPASGLRVLCGVGELGGEVVCGCGWGWRAACPRGIDARNGEEVEVPPAVVPSSAGVQALAVDCVTAESVAEPDRSEYLAVTTSRLGQPSSHPTFAEAEADAEAEAPIVPGASAGLGSGFVAAAGKAKAEVLGVPLLSFGGLLRSCRGAGVVCVAVGVAGRGFGGGYRRDAVAGGGWLAPVGVGGAGGQSGDAASDGVCDRRAVRAEVRGAATAADGSST